MTAPQRSALRPDALGEHGPDGPNRAISRSVGPFLPRRVLSSSALLLTCSASASGRPLSSPASLLLRNAARGLDDHGLCFLSPLPMGSRRGCLSLPLTKDQKPGQLPTPRTNRTPAGKPGLPHPTRSHPQPHPHTPKTRPETKTNIEIGMVSPELLIARRPGSTDNGEPTSEDYYGRSPHLRSADRRRWTRINGGIGRLAGFLPGYPPARPTWWAHRMVSLSVALPVVWIGSCWSARSGLMSPQDHWCGNRRQPEMWQLVVLPGGSSGRWQRFAFAVHWSLPRWRWSPDGWVRAGRP